MANVYDMNHILMPSLGSFPRAWRKDIDTSRPQDFATGLQSHRMSQRCINIINIINFKLFERAMMCYVPVPECTCFVMLEMFSNRDMHVELDIFQVFGVARTQHGFATLRSVWHVCVLSRLKEDMPLQERQTLPNWEFPADSFAARQKARLFH